MSDSRLKVLAVVPDLNQGGGENRILNVARVIDRSRYSYVVATLYSPSATLTAACGSMSTDFSAAGIEVVDLGLSRPTPRSTIRPLQLAATAASLLRATAALWRYLLTEQVDVLDAHLDGSLFVAVAAARAARVPVSITLYGAQALDNKRGGGALRRLSLRQVDTLITDSRKVADDLAAFIGDPMPPTVVVPNGVRLPPPLRSRAEVLADLRLPPSATRIVGQVSGLVPYKGHRTLLRAARRVIDEQPNTYFILIGYPRGGAEYVQSLEQEACELGISDRVRIQSYPGSIADIWQIIDIHVHATDLDSLPNAIIEGMSLGKAAVVTAVGGIPELVEDERTGLVVAPGNHAALAAALLRVLGSETLAQRLGAAAYQRYLERCTPEATVRRLEARFDAMYADRAGVDPSSGATGEW